MVKTKNTKGAGQDSVLARQAVQERVIKEVRAWAANDEVLGLETPLSRYRPGPRSFPEKLPPVTYDQGMEVRKVDISGRIAFAGQTWKVGRAFVKERVGIRPTATDGQFEIIFLTQVIKELDLCQNKITPVP